MFYSSPKSRIDDYIKFNNRGDDLHIIDITRYNPVDILIYKKEVLFGICRGLQIFVYIWYYFLN